MDCVNYCMFQDSRNLFFIFLFLSVLFPLTLYAQPNIVFQKEIHDVGDVTQGEQVEYIFTFENKGTQELIIQKVSSS